MKVANRQGLNPFTTMPHKVVVTLLAATLNIAALNLVTLNVVTAHAAGVVSDNKSTQDLEYGVILFEYYQQDYFSALVEQEYAQTINNEIAKSPSGQVLKGGMMLSYGMSNEAKIIFDKLLNNNTSLEVRNKAWYYLAKLLYKKSEIVNAKDALDKVKGDLPAEFHTQYHYLSTLLGNKGNHLPNEEYTIKTDPNENSDLPYLLFNLAIIQLKENQLDLAVKNLEKVTTYSGTTEELSVLADRARHGLAELAIKHGQLLQAWTYLKDIRNTGLYSNRALLSYAWAAINLKQYNDAIPALEILNGRSIAVPEVQEAKVLLAHVYEQGGSSRKALKSNILAEKDYKAGIKMVNEARRIIDQQEVPREFISNIQALIDDTDWYTSRPSLDYKKLTPFLIDLMASNSFNETLRELADLYAIEENLKYWSIQAGEHTLILENAKKKRNDQSFNGIYERSKNFNALFTEQNTELKLFSLSLKENDQERLKALMSTTGRELKLLNNKVSKLESYKKPYQQPDSYGPMVAGRHEEIKKQLLATQKLTAQFEAILRSLIRTELNQHEERMRYYSAQSRLSKARLYDLLLLSLEKAKSAVKEADAKDGEKK
jgi:hypothetical protein